MTHGRNTDASSSRDRPGPPGGGSYGQDAIARVERIGDLLSDLRTLLEDSSRNVSIARVALAADPALAAAHAVPEIEKNLDGAAAGLERMAELVHGAMQNSALPIGSPALVNARPATLGEAISHALEVMGPAAARNSTRLTMTVPDALRDRPAGGLYTVILNGVQNAVEAVARRAAREVGWCGHVEVLVRTDTPPADFGFGRDDRAWIALEIRDDGDGAAPRAEDRARCFDMGFTTKPKGAGVGLSVARGVVTGLGGTIELLQRDSSQGAPRGAVLHVRFPEVAVRRTAA